MTPSAGPCSGEQRDELARRPVERALAADHVDARLADERVDLHRPRTAPSRGAGAPRARGRAGRRRRRARGSAAGSSRRPGRARARGRSRPSRPDGARSRTPEASATSTASGDAESKSPTATVTSRPSASACSRPLSAAITGAPSGTASAARGSGGAPPDTTTTTSSDTPSSAGITQIRFCGSAALRPPSQPGCPSSPLRSGHRSAAAQGPSAEAATVAGGTWKT